MCESSADAAWTALIDAWIAQVGSRPSRICGMFMDDIDGQSYESRARPWDEPDLLLEAARDGDALHLRFDRHGTVIDLEVTAIRTVEPVAHPWGSGLRVTGDIAGEAAQLWLV